MANDCFPKDIKKYKPKNFGEFIFFKKAVFFLKIAFFPYSCCNIYYKSDDSAKRYKWIFHLISCYLRFLNVDIHNCISLQQNNANNQNRWNNNWIGYHHLNNSISTLCYLSKKVRTSFSLRQGKTNKRIKIVSLNNK